MTVWAFVVTFEGQQRGMRVFAYLAMASDKNEHECDEVCIPLRRKQEKEGGGVIKKEQVTDFLAKREQY